MPKGKRTLPLAWPVGGLNKAYGYQAQAPYTTPDALNVRTKDVLKGRMRGGSRPGLVAERLQVAQASPTILLSQMTIVSTNGYQLTSDSFEGPTLGAAWTGASWINSGALPQIFDSIADASFNSPVGAIYQKIPNLSAGADLTSEYDVSIYILPYNGQHNGKYQIFGFMNDTTPVATTDGFVAELIMQDGTGAFSGSLTVYIAGVPTVHAFTAGSDLVSKPGYFTILLFFNGSYQVAATWGSHTLLAATAIGGSPAGNRVGFGENCTVPGGVAEVANFRVRYKDGSNFQAIQKFVVANQASSVRFGDITSSLNGIGSPCSVSTDRVLIGVERNQKMYIADNGTPAALGTDGVINGAGTQLSAASIADWTVLGINVNDFVVVISAPLGGTIANTVGISSISVGHLTLATTNVAGTCSYRVERGPKVLDPQANIVSNFTILMTAQVNGQAPALGQVPTGCPLSCLYRDRLVFGGAPVAPQAWFMSRQGNPLDWNYNPLNAASDGGRAVAGESSIAGTIAEPLTALIPHTDDYLMFCTANTIYVLYGDAALGGQISALSRTIGCVGKKAWCRGPSGELIFLSRDGIYQVSPGQYGGLMPPQPLSRSKLPQELLNLDELTNNISLEWDTADFGVHIKISPTKASGRFHWFYDYKNQAFWPVQFLNTNHDPFVMMAYNAQNPFDSCVLLGCRDGVIRRYDETAISDDGTAIVSHVAYGPIRLGGDDYSIGLLTELVAILASGSGVVAWEILAANTSEEIVAATLGAITAKAAGTWGRSGLNLKARPRVRGGSALVLLINDSALPWSVESVVAVVEPTSVQRLTT